MNKTKLQIPPGGQVDIGPLVDARSQSLYSFKRFKFYDFPWPFLAFHDLKISCHLRKFSKLSLL